MRRLHLLLTIITAVALATAVCFFAFPHKINKEIYFRYEKNIFSSQQKDIKILFVGDLMLDRGIRYYAEKNGGNDFIFNEISSTLAKNDLVVANLEGPITPEKSISILTKPGETNNYFFTFNPSWAETLYKNNIRIVSLGNNHILNFGREGLKSTKYYLDKANIGYFGAPDYPKSVSKEIGGVRITFINYNEFSAIGELEELATIEEIEKAKEFSDIIIVYSHWGIEYIYDPPEYIKSLAREFIDAGADLVIGSHPHVIEPSEDYKGKKIYYSLGNFIFDQYFSQEVRNGMGVEVLINRDTKTMSFSEISFYLQNNGQTIIK